jgi:hypothetical protein
MKRLLVAGAGLLAWGLACAQAQDDPPRDQQSPQALHQFHKAEIERWWPMLKAAGIKPQ